MKPAIAVAAGVLFATTSAECPNACSLHGECGVKDNCECYDGYTGADCSQRVCPYGVGFVDVPNGDLNHDGQLATPSTANTVSALYSSVQWSRYKQAEYWPTIAGAASSAYLDAAAGGIDPAKLAGGGWRGRENEAHWYTQCSGRGLCDYSKGSCNCFDGYEGAACQRTVCPNDCSGHGICRTVEDIATSGKNLRFITSEGGVNFWTGVSEPFQYNFYDGDKNQACVCDPGYAGADCSLRECPRGDDPLTTLDSSCNGLPCVNEVQGFTIDGAAGNNDKNYRLKFTDFNGAVYVTKDFPVSNSDHDANEEKIAAALHALPNAATGTVVVTSASDGNSDVRITVSFSTLPGNVPSMSVLLGTKNSGVPVVAEPNEPVHVVDFGTSQPAGTVSVAVFPTEDFSTNIRPNELEGSDSTNNAANADVSAMIAAALNDVRVLNYNHGSNAVSVVKVSNHKYLVFMPSMKWGTFPISVKIGTTKATVTVDNVEGNKEYAICSNRGSCDYASGLCKCFAGYIGNACDTQNALAM